MKKQDRQGVRTPADVEQKYNLRGNQKTIEEMRRLNASFLRAEGEVRALMVQIMDLIEKQNEELERQLSEQDERIAELAQEFYLVPVIESEESEGEYTLADMAFADLWALWEDGKCIVLYLDKSETERRYYHCMGCVSGSLVFAYGFGGVSEYITCAEDGITVRMI